MAKIQIAMWQGRNLGVGATFDVKKASPAARINISADQGGTPPGRTITVNGTSASAIDTANAAAVAGDTVYFPDGIYTHPLVLIFKDYVTYLGTGIYDQSGGGGTWIQGPMRWGSHVTASNMLIGRNDAGVTVQFRPVGRGESGSPAGAHTNTNGSHDNLFSFVRFKGGSDSGANLIELSGNFTGSSSGGWANATVKTQDMYSTEWRDCEFERPQSTNAVNVGTGAAHLGRVINVWWDCRAGGAQIHDLTFRRCHFGCRNSRASLSGTDRYGIGDTILFQPSPAEHSSGGPRPSDSTLVLPANGDAVYGWYPGWDPTDVDHSAYNISFIDCVVEWANWVGLNPCDYARSYSIWRYNDLNRPGSLSVAMSGTASVAAGWGNPPGSHWTDIPSDMWIRNVDVTRCYFKTNARWELGYGCNTVNSSGSSPKTYGSGGATGSFSNANRPITAIMPTGSTYDWTSAYTPSPYDPA